ncbi:DUF2797 domain-containing protein [Streptomyces sp. NPDC059740]|uniref:DUF2797 domain-containing protein n=1 Tax=Streptomyces sp. NPDC059740 TaxID=3346926 RepID=UPI00365DB0AF
MQPCPAPWRATGLLWTADHATLGWWRPGAEPQTSAALRPGTRLAFTTGSDRCCLGLLRRVGHIPCPTAAALAPDARSGRCADCTALDRSRSVAADTAIDDPRPYSVYLAHHGEGLVKVGITARQRGSVRLLEQGALASTLLSTGPLLAARRTENLLGAALALPDRVTVQHKRRARLRPGPAEERAGRLTDLSRQARALPGWPEAQVPQLPSVDDHMPRYPLPPEGLRPTAAVRPLEPGATVAGEVVSVIGCDLYLRHEGGLVLLDTRLLAGWTLRRAPEGAPPTAGLDRVAPDARPEPLF